MMVNLLFDECALTIAPSWPELEKKVLTYTEKSMEMVTPPGGKFPMKKIVRRQVSAFNVLSDGPAVRVIQTYHGLLDNVVAFFNEKGVVVHRHDVRDPFPKPDYSKMHGFRFKQRELLTEALQKNRSGLIGAPTRYGKTTLIINTLRAYVGVRTVVTVPGADLVRQLYEDIKKQLPHRNVVLLGAGSTKKFPSDDITVCSMDSLHLCDPGATKLLLIDEPHACVTNSRKDMIAQFASARKLGFGATTTGRFDGRDILITGLIGPLLANRTFLEGVAEGAICMIVVYMLRVKFSPWKCYSRDAAYNTLIFKNEGMAAMASFIGRSVIPADWQNITFIANEKQAELFLKDYEGEGTICMAKRFTPKQRKDIFAQMAGNEIKRCLASQIYAVGVTFSDVRSIVNCAGGGNNTTAIQKPGRLAEIRPGKKAGYMFDFLMECDEPARDRAPGQEWTNIERDSQARLKAYREKGYEVHIVDAPEDLISMFAKREGL